MPDWSPRGDKINFVRQRKGYSDIFVMDADGTGVVNLTQTPKISEFARDGRPMRERSCSSGASATTTSGRCQIILTNLRGPSDGGPSYSPDGTRILFVHADRVFTMNASGSVLTGITSDEVRSNATSWQPLACTIEGTEGADPAIAGTGGDDVICGLGGDDVVDGMGGNDTIIGGPGNDLLAGGLGEDIVVGSRGADRVEGNDGNDGLAGGAGPDDHAGGAGEDYLFAWDYAGTDVLRGGLGVDRCAYERGDTVRC